MKTLRGRNFTPTYAIFGNSTYSTPNFDGRGTITESGIVEIFWLILDRCDIVVRKNVDRISDTT